jgi:hypothetical protein
MRGSTAGCGSTELPFTAGHLHMNGDEPCFFRLCLDQIMCGLIAKEQ